MKSLKRLSTDNLVTQIIKGTISLKKLDDLNWKSYKMVTDKLFSYDLEVWKRNIMKSLSLIELKKCKDFILYDYEKLAASNLIAQKSQYVGSKAFNHSGIKTYPFSVMPIPHLIDL